MRTASRPHLSPHRHRRQPGPLVATAALCLAAQLLGLVHLLVVRHATCLAHDELVHSSAAARDQVGAPVVEPGERAAAVPTEAGHADDHCLVVASRRRDQATLSASAVRLPPAAPPAALLAVLPDERTTTVVPLLHLAPKSSPPRAAVSA